ncbi:hypothetical protein PYCC9005_002478 [Savitreella phatthalungensis]
MTRDHFSNPLQIAFDFDLDVEQADCSDTIASHETLKLLFATDADALAQWIESLPAVCTLGFDTEGAGRLIQLCCQETSSILVFFLDGRRIEGDDASESRDPTSYNRVLSSLSKVLSSKNYLKVGMGAIGDALAIWQLHGLECVRVVDLQKMDTASLNEADLRNSRHLAAPSASIGPGSSDNHRRSTSSRVRGFLGLKALYAQLYKAQFTLLLPRAQGLSRASAINIASHEISPRKQGTRGPAIQSFTKDRFSSLGRFHDFEMATITSSHGKRPRWSHAGLSHEDLLYAAKDAYCSIVLFNAIASRLPQQKLARLLKRSDRSVRKCLDKHWGERATAYINFDHNVSRHSRTKKRENTDAARRMRKTRPNLAVMHHAVAFASYSRTSSQGRNLATQMTRASQSSLLDKQTRTLRTVRTSDDLAPGQACVPEVIEID